jgi:hypothetical protein
VARVETAMATPPAAIRVSRHQVGVIEHVHGDAIAGFPP